MRTTKAVPLSVPLVPPKTTLKCTSRIGEICYNFRKNTPDDVQLIFKTFLRVIENKRGY